MSTNNKHLLILGNQQESGIGPNYIAITHIPHIATIRYFLFQVFEKNLFYAYKNVWILAHKGRGAKKENLG
jgi:hypothetical protein